MVFIYGVVTLAAGYGLIQFTADVLNVANGRSRIYGIVFYFGWLLVAAPLALTAFEVLYAASTNATGETAAQAGTFGFLLGMLTVIPGFILMAIGQLMR